MIDKLRFIFAVVCFGWSGAIAKADVEIAVVGGLTGVGAIHSLRGMEYSIEQINAKGGLLGQKLRVAFFDDGCDADQGEAAAKLVLDEHPSLVVGHNCSAPSIRAAPLYAKAGVIQISTQSTNIALTDLNIKTVFRMIGRDDKQGAAAAALIAQRWPKARVAVLDDREPFGKGLADNLRNAMAARHMPIAFSQSFTAGDPTYGEIITALTRDKIGVLYVAGYPEDIGLLLHEIRASNLTTQVLTGDPGAGNAVFMAAGPSIEGLLFSSPRDPLRNPAVISLIDEARTKGFEMDGFGVVNYAAVQAWAQAVERANSFNAEKVADALHNGQFDTVIGRLGFDAKGDVTGALADWVWYRWHDGKTEPDAVP
jgi:branched-chain amino acid transport system substrate-binding protein